MNPEVLIAGSQRLHDIGDQMRSVLHTLRGAHDQLRGTWTGQTADTADARLTELLVTFDKNLDELTHDAAQLRTAAGLYQREDHASAAVIDEQM
ncbi:WXG100 family type VII secretion target [Mycolicibacterium goodii]|uniref:WXG100 family type VII secretion target n=1 Tax=Mycolicibacterium goodii TaxID=134601 RepID=UPI001BDD47CF|nr:WXG100 family type VII secretion target [Mycolicibacterium goodii]MBU8820401.1 WXG100 family type VII secretion target [Mycolicibacterium goodii]